MRTPRALLVIVLPLLMAASDKPAAGPATEFAEGAVSLLVSKRCEKSPRSAAPSIELPALVYARAKPPSWGRKPAGACGGLDTWVLSESLAAGAMWSQTDHKVIEADPMTTMFDDAKSHAAFKKAFGWDLPERGDDLPPPNVFLKYESKRLSALFDRIYVKPTETIAGAPAQQVYDVLFKDAVTRFAREVALVKTGVPKSQLAKLLKAYQAAAKEAGYKFKGPAYLKDVAASALPKDQELSARAGRTLGVILRRTGDGTWPVFNRLLKKVVGDYDPALAQELGTAL
jgi:hypothetical protein